MTELYQVDAFSRAAFRGNPAAVCPLDEWLPDETMQRIAAENNLSETAFFTAPTSRGDRALRWFTPKVEVDLCGHATLASGYVVLEHLEPGSDRVTFQSRSGALSVQRQAERFELDFPARPVDRRIDTDDLPLGARPKEAWYVAAAKKIMAVFESQAEVAALEPDFRRFDKNIVATSPGDGDVDFVSRYFAPCVGIDEDPVTGSAHCTLAPFWAERLGRDQLYAQQISARGGELWCRVGGDRVFIAGHAALYLRGTIYLP